MDKFSLFKQLRRATSDLVHCKMQLRAKTSKPLEEATSTSAFSVTEEKIPKDSLGDNPPISPQYECCGECCANCVWLRYLIELKFYTNNDKHKIKEALKSITDIDVRSFVEFEFKKSDSES